MICLFICSRHLWCSSVSILCKYLQFSKNTFCNTWLCLSLNILCIQSNGKNLTFINNLCGDHPQWRVLFLFSGLINPGKKLNLRTCIFVGIRECEQTDLALQWDRKIETYSSEKEGMRNRDRSGMNGVLICRKTKNWLW